MKTIDVVLNCGCNDAVRELHASVSKNARYMVYARLHIPIYGRLFNISLENQILEDITKI
jgi:hypothetical protein